MKSNPLNNDPHEKGPSRRGFLETIALGSTATFLAEKVAQAQPNAVVVDWTKRVGLETYRTINWPATSSTMSADAQLSLKDLDNYLAKVAEIGYKEIEPASYLHFTPKDFKAALDRHGLSMPTTQPPLQSDEPLAREKELEVLQALGVKYIDPGMKGQRIDHQRNEDRPGVETLETARHTAALLNANGKLLQKFGMKQTFHQHTTEWWPLAGSDLSAYDVILAETDPALVTMKLDIGWAYVGGQDIVGLFNKNPGRFEVWHVKDCIRITPYFIPQKNDPRVDVERDMERMPEGERKRIVYFTPVGEGQVDYKTIFSYYRMAGLKHFFVEQDNVADWGDALAAVKVSYDNLVKNILPAATVGLIPPGRSRQ
jgi:sugar phosphate isomerase/epimerase